MTFDEKLRAAGYDPDAVRVMAKRIAQRIASHKFHNGLCSRCQMTLDEAKSAACPHGEQVEVEIVVAH